jgi:hypothetical protein
MNRAMEPSDKIINTERKIKSLEQDLNDLRQGLTIVNDYYRDLARVSLHQDAVEEVDRGIAKPLVDDDIEFEGIWRFREDVLIPDPDTHVPCTAMYEAFVCYCNANGRDVIGQEAFEFVFAHIENPAPVLDRGEWIGYRLGTAGD